MTDIAIDPLPEQVKAFLANHPDGEPVYMLNLLKFKTRATYFDGEDISGAQAYGRYGEAFAKLVASKNMWTAPILFLAVKLEAGSLGKAKGNGTPSRFSAIPMPRRCLKR